LWVNEKIPEILVGGGGEDEKIFITGKFYTQTPIMKITKPSNGLAHIKNETFSS